MANDILIGLKPLDSEVPTSVTTNAGLATYIQSLEDFITIKNGKLTDSKIENIGFADGGVYKLDRWKQGTSAAETGSTALNGTEYSDVLNGGLSGDVMAGGKGDDVYVVDDISASFSDLTKM